MTETPFINNAIYNELGERWYEAHDDPVALLRAEARLRNGWVVDTLASRLGAPHGDHRPRLLDIGCGAGFLSNPLAQAGYEVDAVDLSAQSLAVAARHDAAHSVRYRQADAYDLPFASASFDAVCAMDFLEHVQEPQRVVAQAARVLKPGGLFFYYTFNRNPVAGLFAIKGIEWFVRNTPRRMHRYRLFIRPGEMRRMCEDQGLAVREVKGARPVFSGAFWKLLWTGVVPAGFRFTWTASTLVSYAGFAQKT